MSYITVFPVEKPGLKYMPVGGLIANPLTFWLVGLSSISLYGNTEKNKNLCVLNTCWSVNGVVQIEAGSLIQAGGGVILLF